MNIEEIKAREQAATPGPWNKKLEENATLGKYVWHFCNSKGNLVMDDVDAAFIAHAHTDIPELIAEVERLTKENVALTEKLKKTAALAGKWDDQLLAEDEIMDSLKAENATLKKNIIITCAFQRKQTSRLPR